MSLEKDCFDHVVFKQAFFYFQCSSQVVAIPFCCIKYFATSWNFACIVRELEKHILKKYKLIKN